MAGSVTSFAFLVSSALLQWMLLHRVPFVISASVPNPNVALLKPAKQSSTSGTSDTAHVAVDGNAGMYGPQDCTSTSTSGFEEWPWWLVDLKHDVTIKSIRLINYAGSLDNFAVEVSTQDPSTLIGFPGRAPAAAVCLESSGPVSCNRYVTYACTKPVTGRYVRLVQHNPNTYVQPLVLCEFEAYTYVEGGLTVPPPLPNNLALNKPAFQSTTYNPYIASMAVDGNLHGHIEHNSCTHTAQGSTTGPQWWMVDLEGQYVIDSVRIATRTDCCQDRLQHFAIEVSALDPSTLGGFPGLTTERSQVCHVQEDVVTYLTPATYVCDQAAVGRYVRVVNTLLWDLTLCEFEVFGRPLPDVAGSSFEYVAGRRAADSVAMERRLMTNCLRRRVQGAEENTLGLDRYVTVDLKNGACHFYKTLAESLLHHNSSGEDWVCYVLTNI